MQDLWKSLCLFTLAATVAVGVAAVPAADESSDPKSKAKSTPVIDLTAVSVITDGITKLKTLLPSYLGKPQEWEIRARLVESYEKKASLFQKVQDAKWGKSNYYKQYHEALDSELIHLNALIANCDKHRICGQAYLSRGVIYKNKSETTKALADFNLVIKKFPDGPGFNKALFHSGEVSITLGHYEEAIQTLSQLETKETISFYPQVLDRLAWAYASKGDFEKAIEINSRNIQLMTTNRLALKPGEGVNFEVLALNASIFLARAIEGRKPGFSGEEAARFLRKEIDEPFRTIAIRSFPGLLTREDLAPEIDAFAKALISLQPEMNSTWEVAKYALERALALRRLAAVEDWLAVFKSAIDEKNPKVGSLNSSLKKAEKNLTSLFTEENEQNPSPQNAADRRWAATLLKTVYALGSEAFQENGESAAKFRFNLAALEFAEKDYEVAESHFRSIAGTKSAVQEKAVLQSIKVRYYRLLGLLDKGDESGLLEPLLKEWDEWRREYSKLAAKPESLSALTYDIARLCHEKGQREISTKRLIQVIVEKPESPNKQEAAKLILSRYSTDRNWKELNRLTTLLLKMNWEAPFKAGLFNLKANSSYQIALAAHQAKRHDEVIAIANETAAHPMVPASDAQIFSLAANSAIESGNRNLALKFMAQVERLSPSPANRYRQVVLQGNISEEAFNIESALGQYLAFFSSLQPTDHGKVGEPQLAQLRSRIWLLSVVSSNPRLIERVVAVPRICPLYDAGCEQIAALGTIYSKERGPKALSKHRRLTPFLAAALKLSTTVSESAPLSDVETLMKAHQAQIKVSGKNNGKPSTNDYYLAYAVFSNLLPAIHRSLEHSRLQLKNSFPATWNPKAFSKRMEDLKSLEKSVAMLETSYFPYLATSSVEVMRAAYTDFSTDLEKIRTALASLPEPSPSLPVVEEMSGQFKSLAENLPTNSATGLVPATSRQESSRLLASLAFKQPLDQVGPNAQLDGQIDPTVSRRQALKQTLVQSLNGRRWAEAKYLTQLGTQEGLLAAEELADANSALELLLYRSMEEPL